ncbi:MAG: hypothetical protein L0229_17895 [Blastocatellia bacterium]|nr:hypothetical protein [Blastocatellia bacterium]
MKSRLKRMAFWSLGWSFILLGIAGLFLPVLQGILFLLIGLSLLSTVSPWAGRLLARVKGRFPRLHGKLDEAKVKAREWQVWLLKKLNQAKAKNAPVEAAVNEDNPPGD